MLNLDSTEPQDHHHALCMFSVKHLLYISLRLLWHREVSGVCSVITATMGVLCVGTMKEKMRLMLDMYDLYGSGYLSVDEFKTMLKLDMPRIRMTVKL